MQGVAQPHEQWLGKLSFEDAPSQRRSWTTSARSRPWFSVAVCWIRRCPRRSGAREQPRRDGREAALLQGIDTLTAAGLCAEVGDFTGCQAGIASRGSWVLVPSEGSTSDESAPRDRSRRPGHRTPDDYWSRLRTIIVTGRRCVWVFKRAKPAKTLVSCRSPGTASAACTSAGHTSRAPAASAPERSRSPAHASSPRSAGRPRPSTDAHLTYPTLRRLPGHHEQTRRSSRRRSTGPRTRAMGNPRFTPWVAPASRLRARRRTRVLR